MLFVSNGMPFQTTNRGKRSWTLFDSFVLEEISEVSTPVDSTCGLWWLDVSFLHSLIGCADPSRDFVCFLLSCSILTILYDS